MRCPYCNEHTESGTYCQVCGERLPKRSRKGFIIALVISVIVIAIVMGVGVTSLVHIMHKAPEPTQTPILSSSAFAEKPPTLEEEREIAKKKLLEQEAQYADGSTIDQIIGYWKAGDYAVHIQKVATATYRWVSTTNSEDVYKMHINNDNRYVMEDDSGVSYVFGIEDFDNLKFYSIRGADGGLPEDYDIPYKAAWKRTDENGNEIVRTSADKDSFWIVGQTFADVYKYYTKDKAYYEDNKTPVVAMKNKAGTTFVLSFIESNKWSWSKKSTTELNMPADIAQVKSIKAPLDFFLDSQKSVLTVKEIADVLPGESTPVISQDAKTTIIKWQHNNQKLSLTLEGTENFALNNNVILRLED